MWQMDDSFALRPRGLQKIRVWDRDHTRWRISAYLRMQQDAAGLEQGRAQRGLRTLEEAEIVASRCRIVLNVD